MRPRGSITQRSPGSYRLRYSLGRDPVTGKRKWGTATIRGTRAEAERELTRRLKAANAGEHVDPSRLIVGDWLRLWLDTMRPAVTPKTHERYADIVRCYLVPTLGGLRLQKLMPSGITRAYARFDRNPSPRTRRHIHRILRSALERAVEQQVIVRNPADAITRLPKVERQPIATLTVEQSNQLLRSLAHTTTYWPVLIALATGMRRGEILALRWGNVDLDRGIVSVVESLEQTRARGLRFKSPKSGKGRSITLPRFAMEELRRRKREQAEALLALGVRQDGRTLVCATQDGSPRSPESFTTRYMEYVAKAGVPKVRFHDLRHSHATQLLTQGVHPKVVQERLGHSSISMTLDIYSHVTATMQADAAATLDAAYGPRTN
jgi:integrase